jgi:hypothetical protein
VTEYLIYSPEVPNDEGQSFGRAAYAFFKIVNDQLTKSEYRLYAINGGNELGGMFLTQSECETARRSLPGKGNWPYLPTLDHPWYANIATNPASEHAKGANGIWPAPHPHF